MKENVLKKSKKKVMPFLLIVQKNVPFFYPRTSSGNFVRLELHTWQINSIIKPNSYVPWTQMERKLYLISKVVQTAQTERDNFSNKAVCVLCLRIEISHN